MSVHAILNRKGSNVYAIEDTASLADAANSLTDHGVGALVVMGSGGQIVGIISERDIVRALSAMGGAALATPVADIMTRKVAICRRRSKLVDLMQHMTEGKFRHFPVIEEGGLVGIISIGDVVKYRLEELEQESSTLREHVHRRSRQMY